MIIYVYILYTLYNYTVNIGTSHNIDIMAHHVTSILADIQSMTFL